MKIPFINNHKTLKEKENILSLFRIPLNFFEDKKISNDNIKTNSKDAKISNITNNTADSPDEIKKISPQNNTIEIDISNLNQNLSNTISSKTTETYKETDNLKNSNEEITTANIASNPTTANQEKNDNNVDYKKDNSKPTSTIPNPTNNPSDNSLAEPLNDTSLSHPSNKSASSPLPSDIPQHKEDNHSPTTPKKDNTPSPTYSPSKLNNSKNMSPKKEDHKKGPDLDRYKKMNSKNNSSNSKKPTAKDNVKNKIGNKVKQNPAIQKALKNPNVSKTLNTIDTAKKVADNTKEAINNLNVDKAQEAMGQVLSTAAAKASNYLVAGAEHIVNWFNNTKLGKKFSKLLGKIGCFSCLGSIVLAMLPLVFMILSVSWITNLFRRDNTIFGELTDAEFQDVQEASTWYSMQQYTDLTISLGDPKNPFVSASDAPIQEALEEYLTEHYRFSEDDVKQYNDKYGYLIKKDILFPIEEGQLTSFGSAFELLKKNYAIHNLKAPSSAPQRKKTLPSGEVVTYTTYDPTGIHQALFEDVLKDLEDNNDLDKLKNRFDGQVEPEWFDELKEILTTKKHIYLEGIDNPDLIKTPNSLPERSLLDLLKETSRQPYDTLYYSALIEQAFNIYNGTNAEMVQLYSGLNPKTKEYTQKNLVDRLSMLELMTYMLSYQKYYNQTNSFKEDFKNSGYVNLDDFNPEFFAKFLTFSNVEYYLALSNLSDHSLTYEIAIASIEATSDNIDFTTMYAEGGKYLAITKYDNWYATYYLEPTSPQDIATSITSIKHTHIQQFLFDKYNVEADIYLNEDTSDAQNQSAFFGAFELATGIKLAIIDVNGVPQTPVYQEIENELYQMPISNYTNAVSSTKAFPLADPSKARVSMGFNKPYSQETIEQFGFPQGKRHAGIDYAVPQGSLVVAAAPGIASVYRGNNVYGNYVKIKHPDGYTSIYAHGNGTFYVKNNETVEKNQPIMLSGNSGNSSGPHLHFEVRDPHGNKINPNTYISKY